MSTPKTILKLLITYYVAQTVTVHYHMLKLHWTPPPPPPTNKTITITKTVDVTQSRDHLTQEQLIQIRNDVLNEDLAEFHVLGHSEELTQAIESNLNTIQRLAKDERMKITPLPPRRQVDAAEPKPAASIFFLSSLLDEKSFVDYTNKDLQAIFQTAIAELSSLTNYDISFDQDADASASEVCTKFLTRNAAAPIANANTKYLTSKKFEMLIADIKQEIAAIKAEPLSEPDRTQIVQNFVASSKSEYMAVKDKVFELVQGLQLFVDDFEDDNVEEVGEDDCVKGNDVRTLLDTGMAALAQNEDVYAALSTIVDDLDESIVAKSQESVEDDSANEEKKQTLKDMMSSPLYPKVIEKIDAMVESIAGYSDGVDQVIDSLGGTEEGGVGKKLERTLNRLADKVEVPTQYASLKQKAGVSK